MRSLSSFRNGNTLLRALKWGKPITATSSILHLNCYPPSRSLAQVRSDHEVLPDLWLTNSRPLVLQVEGAGMPSPPDHPPPDARTIKLGRTLRTLQNRLPSLLASPLPQEILSPHISLHLFPSTHPHLPAASGRVAYHAALWTSPVAWGKVPLLNVKLIILSEKVVKGPSRSSQTGRDERLIVRWKTSGKTKGKGMGAFYRGIGGSERVDKITEWLGGDIRDDQEFCGLFIFEFDEEGRILSHTIEHADETRHEEKTSKVVSITDWLLGRMNGNGKERVPELAWQFNDDGYPRHVHRRILERERRR